MEDSHIQNGNTSFGISIFPVLPENGASQFVQEIVDKEDPTFIDPLILSVDCGDEQNKMIKTCSICSMAESESMLSKNAERI